MTASTAPLTAGAAPRTTTTAGATGRAITRRVAGSVLVLWASVTLTFFVLRLTPGDPITAILGGAGSAPSEETVAALRAEYGLDQPVIVQYLGYLGGLLRGDFGTSYVFQVPVWDIVGPQILPTLQLAGLALVFAWGLALTFTLLTVGRGRVLDGVGRSVEVLFASLPAFWVGIMLAVVFAVTLGWFPVAGDDGFVSLVLPALSLAIPLSGFIAQVTRSSFEDALAQPFVLSARARGLGDTAVRITHALRHAILPGITLSAWAVGSLMSSAVVAEIIFARPGLGRSLVDAITNRDLPITLAVVVVIAAVYILVNLAVDVLYRVVDPRTSSKGSAA
ncbi:ABC transporter permease [Arthrobacter sp. RIT-PI-e]|uniref:ABC transporter permease n=1 Tax=Arthrobacter sp. RIT-PI-e TaxID=1681197 RepID=UPI000675DF59|nr:ABC transporter permease [Arthrobacter sp. RIT-PI-e]KNC20192.1 ABC transporter permease [Arthrobacter sp. RIT-PI-e]